MRLNFSGMMLTDKLRKIIDWIVRPVRRERRFFFAVMVLCCLPCVAFSVVEGVRIFHFLAFTVAESAAVAYLLAWVAGVIRRRAWRIVYMTVCVALLGLWTLLEIGCLATTHTLISDDTIALMAETDRAEASGFFKQYFGLRALGVLTGSVAAGAALAAGLCWAAGRMLSRRWGVMVSALCLVVLVPAGTVCSMRLLPGAFISDLQRYMVWAGEGGENPELIRANELRYAVSVVKVPCVINGYHLVNGSFDRWLRVQKEALRSKVCGSDSAQFNVVVVVGESFIRSHSQLYGYYLPTNPRLSAECDSGRLIVYDDVTTTANFTTPALRNMLNLNNLSAGEEWYEGVYFPLLMRLAGYEVYHYDNQTADMCADRGISRMFYSPLILDSVYNAVSDKVFDYDGDYLDYVSSRCAPGEGSGRKLVIYHLKGQHFPVSARYKGAPHFTARDITVERSWLTDSRRAEVADYDNATLYNDSIVAAVAGRYAQTPTVMLYFSDHGEDCWDLAPMEARNKQMPEDPAWVERQFHVPFFVWMSAEFMERYPLLVQRLRRAARKPFSLGDLGHLVLGLCGVETKYYDPALDPLRD